MSARIQLTLVGESAEYVREYAQRHNITIAEAARRGLSLIALIDTFGDNEVLAVLNEGLRTIEAVDLPWRPRPARHLRVLK